MAQRSTVLIGQERRELHKEFPQAELESTIKNLSQEVGKAIFETVLQILDDQIQKAIPTTIHLHNNPFAGRKFPSFWYNQILALIAPYYKINEQLKTTS